MKGVVDHVIRTLSPMAKRGVTMERFIADKLPPIVADERRVIQLLSNLLGNALKFTDKGKVGGVALRGWRCCGPHDWEFKAREGVAAVTGAQAKQ